MKEEKNKRLTDAGSAEKLHSCRWIMRRRRWRRRKECRRAECHQSFILANSIMGGGRKEGSE